MLFVLIVFVEFYFFKLSRNMEEFMRFYEKCTQTFENPTESKLCEFRQYVSQQKFELDSRHQNLLVDAYLMKLKTFYDPIQKPG